MALSEADRGDGPVGGRASFLSTRRALARTCGQEGLHLGFRHHRVMGEGGHLERRRAASRQLLARVLTQASGHAVAASEWGFGRSACGRPDVIGPQPGWSISISYAQDLIVVAVGHGRRVGIDLEAIAERPTADPPDHLLSRHEQVLVRADPVLLAAVWTLKESLAKERGKGLIQGAADLDVASFVMASPGMWLCRPDGGRILHTPLRLSDRGYQLAIAVTSRFSGVSDTPGR